MKYEVYGYEEVDNTICDGNIGSQFLFTDIFFYYRVFIAFGLVEMAFLYHPSFEGEKNIVFQGVKWNETTKLQPINHAKQEYVEISLSLNSLSLSLFLQL